MRIIVSIFILGAVLLAAPAGAQSFRKEPHVGYLYPAGGRQGTTFTVIAGGQNLKTLSEVRVSKEGVRAAPGKYLGRVKRLSKEERKELGRRLDLREALLLGRKVEEDQEAQGASLPEHPLLDHVETLTLEEIAFLREEFLSSNKKKQPNEQISERVVIEVTIDPDAEPGDRELRLVTEVGLTNPICFQVGALPEICEAAPYDEGPAVTECPELPVLINGQIKAGDVDRFGFEGREGQRLVIEVKARHLIPYLADAVPGWFQATLTLFDGQGNELAFADDYRFESDPVLFFPVTETGRYEVEIRDAIYRGREDFVYRITVGEQPFVESIFPLGSREEDVAKAKVTGWNLERKRIPLDTGEGDGAVRQTALRQHDLFSNPVTYGVDPWPDCRETEPNDTREQAQKIKLPRIVDGRIDSPSDEDLFKFKGKAGEDLVVEVYGRRLNSPIDSLVRVMENSGEVLAWNDDYDYRDGFLYRDMGLITHHADSYLRVSLPRDAWYYVHLKDAQHHGGDAYGYRLRLGPPRPDFSLFMTPSSVSVRSGLTAPICVYLLRRDGFDKEVRVGLKGDAQGFTLDGGLIPSGCDRIHMTLTAPIVAEGGLFSLALEGEARIGEQTLCRGGIPSEEMMQAFLYRHLVPSQELVVSVERSKVKKRARPELVNMTPIQIEAGGRTLVRFKVPRHAKLEDLGMRLVEPPEGLTIESVQTEPGQLAFVLQADREAAVTAYVDNLIVAVFTDRAPDVGEVGAKPKQISLGVLPALPFRIVEPLDP